MCVSACKNCAPVTLKMQAAFLSIWLIPSSFSVKLEHGQRIIWCAQSSMLQWHTLKVVICIWEIGQCCPLGLEVWFLLWVQEVPGSIPGVDLGVSGYETEGTPCIPSMKKTIHFGTQTTIHIWTFCHWFSYEKAKHGCQQQNKEWTGQLSFYLCPSLSGAILYMIKCSKIKHWVVHATISIFQHIEWNFLMSLHVNCGTVPQWQ